MDSFISHLQHSFEHPADLNILCWLVSIILHLLLYSDRAYHRVPIHHHLFGSVDDIVHPGACIYLLRKQILKIIGVPFSFSHKT